MTYNFFFWYVLPLLISFGALGWLAYDKRAEKKRNRPHPGE